MKKEQIDSLTENLSMFFLLSFSADPCFRNVDMLINEKGERVIVGRRYSVQFKIIVSELEEHESSKFVYVNIDFFSTGENKAGFKNYAKFAILINIKRKSGPDDEFFCCPHPSEIHSMVKEACGLSLFDN